MKTVQQLRHLIPKAQKKKLLLLVVLLIIGMLLEALGLGALIPILTLVLDPEKLLTIQLVGDFFNRLNLTSTQDFVAVALALLMGIYLIKILFQVFLTYIQNRFLSRFSQSIFYRLYLGYMDQPYTFHLQRNSAELNKNVQVETSHFLNFLTAIIGLITETGMVLAIAVTLIYIEPIGALGIMVFFILCATVFHQLTKRKLLQWGAQRIEFDDQIAKTTLESLTGIKALKILNRTGFFKTQLSKSLKGKFDLTIKHNTLVQIPRLYLELISVFALVVFIFLMVAQGKDTQQLMTTLGIFVAATFRMIPSINRVVVSFQGIKYYQTSVDLLFKEFRGFQENKHTVETPKKLPFKKKINIEKLSFQYTSNQKLVLEELSFQLKKGETIGIMGASGCGKSTLVDVLCGLFPPTQGKITIDDVLLDPNTIPSWQKNIGYVPQSIFLTDDSIAANVALGIPIAEHNRKRIQEVLEQAQLTGFIASLEQGMDTTVGEQGVQLSGGQRQRIGIARALYHQPEVLILDEATSALDTQTEKGFLDTVHKLKGQKTILMVAHRLSTLKASDVIYEIDKGKMERKTL